MKNKNIGHVVSGYPEYYTSGGAAKSAKKIAEVMSSRGHSIKILSTALKEPNSPPTESRGHPPNLEIIRPELISNRLGYDFKLPISLQFRDRIQEHISDLDLLHIHEFRTYQTMIACRVASQYEVPVVLQPRGSMPRLNKFLYKKSFDYLFSGQILDNSDCCIFSSDSEIECAPDDFVEKFEKRPKIPNGIDFDIYQPIDGRPDLLEKHNIPESSEIILFLSRVEERKGLTLLIRSIGKLLEGQSDLELVIAGPDEGGLASAISTAKEHGVDDSVTYVGPVYGDEKIKLYSNASLFVLPSTDRYESFGNVVLESLACGTPAVATEVCGVTEWVSNSNLSVCTPTEDDLQQSVNNMLHREDLTTPDHLRTEIEDFSWPRIVDQYEKVYSNVLSNNNQ